MYDHCFSRVPLFFCAHHFALSPLSFTGICCSRHWRFIHSPLRPFLVKARQFTIMVMCRTVSCQLSVLSVKLHKLFCICRIVHISRAIIHQRASPHLETKVEKKPENSFADQLSVVILEWIESWNGNHREIVYHLVCFGEAIQFVLFVGVVYVCTHKTLAAHHT